MGICGIPLDILCRNHQLAEYWELHAIWSILIKDKKGYSLYHEILR